MKRGYKETEIGEIPVEWEVKYAKNIFSLEYGKSLPEQLRKTGIFPVLGSNGIVGYHDQAICSSPGIVVGRKGSAGSVIWTDSDFYPIDTTYYTDVRSNVDKQYLYYLLVNQKLYTLAQKAAVPGLNRDDVYSLRLPIPTLPEQKKIAEILSSVDEAIRATQAVIDQTKTLKQGLLNQLLTKGIGHKKFKQTEIGEIPVEWEVKELYEVSDIHRGFAFKSEDYRENGIMCFRVSNINSDGNILKNDVKYLPECFWQEYKEYQLHADDFVIVMVGATTGKIGRLSGLNEKALLNQNMWKFNHLGNIEKLFLYFIVSRLPIRTQGGAHGFLKLDDIGKQLVAIPPLPEQNKIAELLTSIDETIRENTNNLEQLKATKSGLMQDLLTGKKRVQYAQP